MDYYSNGILIGNSYPSVPINDNQNHTITIVALPKISNRFSNQIKLYVDDKLVKKSIFVKKYPSGNIFIGGLNRFPFEGKYSNGDGFYGCINSINVTAVSLL